MAEKAFERVADHVETCASCAETVRQLEASPVDLFLRQIRRPRLKPEFEHEIQCLELVAAVQSIQLDERASSRPSRHVQETALENLGPYQFLEKLGQGGMGTVFKARHEHLDRLFAIKLLPADRLDDEKSISRFRREMKVVGKFTHPHLVQATDAGEAEGRHFLVMELLEGVDVGRVARRHAPIRVADACEIVRQAAIGLTHVHQHGMVHRDVKPSNLMLARCSEGRVTVKILDLGLALLHESSFRGHDESVETEVVRCDGLTDAGHFMGTVEYMAPEQGADSHAVDARADVYSLGATLYRLLSDQAPCPADQGSRLAPMTNKVDGPAPSLGDCRGDLPSELVALVDQMIARDPDKRIPSAQQSAELLLSFTVGHDLGRLLETTEANISSPDNGAGTANSNPKKRVIGNSRTRLWTVTIASMALLGAIHLHLQTRSDPDHVDHANQGNQAAFDELDLDREVANWVLSLGGLIGPDHDTVWRAKEDLPDAPFQLMFVNLSDTEVADEDLTRLRDLKSLNSLALNANESQTRLTNDCLKPLRDLRGSLEYLGLFCVPIDDTGLRHLSTLRSIEQINLTGTRITDEGLQYLAHMKRLSTLSVADTQISGAGLAHLDNCHEMQIVFLGRTRLDDDALQAMPTWPQLKELHVENTLVSDRGLESVARYKSLRWLEASNLFHVTSTNSNWLAQLEGLQKLTIDGNRNWVTDEVIRLIATLPELRELDISRTSITNVGVEHLASSKTLRSLNLQGNGELTVRVVSRLARALPSCVIQSDFTQEQMARAMAVPADPSGIQE